MPVRQDVWESHAGPPAQLFHLENSGIVARVTNLGASLVGCDVPDRAGNVVDIVLQYPSPDGYRNNASNFGSIVGRYANRIREGRFELDGTTYELEINNGPNCLHSGSSNFAHRIWEPKVGDDSVTFSLTSPDGDGGFPGRLDVEVTYSLTDDAELVIDYSARCDAPTVVSLTNHAYFNIAGHAAGSVLGHEVQIHADRVLEPDENVLPTGEILDVDGTPFDFREVKRVDWDWDNAGGYDHCFVINGVDISQPDGVLRPAAILHDPVSDRTMEVSTTLPGIQLYTANHLDGASGNAGYHAHAGLCLECQQFPASPNYDNFPSTILRPDEVLNHRTVHRFTH